jgi:hypothetical protein
MKKIRIEINPKVEFHSIETLEDDTFFYTAERNFTGSYLTKGRDVPGMYEVVLEESNEFVTQIRGLCKYGSFEKARNGLFYFSKKLGIKIDHEDLKSLGTIEYQTQRMLEGVKANNGQLMAQAYELASVQKHAMSQGYRHSSPKGDRFTMMKIVEMS